MLKLILSSTAIIVSLISFAECSYCTSIESAMENPSKVIHLDLKAQGLETLPEELNEFVNLLTLDVSDNYLMDLDFSSLLLSSLESIDFEYNAGLNLLEIEGINLAFPALRKLNADNCSLIFISPEISSLSNLEEVSFANNSLKFLPEDLQELPELRYLNLSNNNLEDADWLKDLWMIQDLDVSGNSKLDLHKVGIALMYKENLEKLTVTPSGRYDALPSVFSSIKLKEVAFSEGVINTVNRKLIKNTHIEQITFKNVEINNAPKAYALIDQIESLKRVDFNDMLVLSGYSKINSIEEIRFKNCTFEEEGELKKIASSVNVAIIGADLEVEGTASNEADPSGILEGNSIVPMTDAMISNSVEPIVEPTEQVFKINPNKPHTLDLEYSSYDIPSEAFLDKDGEVYTGEVELKITEYMDPVMNALSGAPMTYREGSNNNIFASSGMIDFRAYDEEGNELSANPQSTIEAEIDDLQPSEESDLYVYNEADSNWVDIGTPESSDYDKRRQHILDSLNNMSDEAFLNFSNVQIPIVMEYKKSRRDPYEISFVTPGRKRKDIRRISQVSTLAKTGNADQYWLCNSIKSWKIDTVVTEEIKSVLKEIKDEQSKSINKYDVKIKNMDYIPRLIRDLRIEPNFEDDNYRMTFKYKDTLINLPVISSYGGSINQIQVREKRNFIEYEKKMKAANKEQEVIERFKKDVLVSQIAIMKENRATALASQPLTAPTALGVRVRSRLRFRISFFGLINCDRINRVVPNLMVRLSKKGRDRSGKEVEVPEEIRSVLLEDNSYVSTSSDEVPVFEQKQILFFVINALEVAVIKGWTTLKNGLKQPDVERISIDGVKPEDVRQKILDAG